MTSLTLELTPELYERLNAEAKRQGKSTVIVVEEMLAERLPPMTQTNRDRTTEVLRAAGLVAAPSAEKLRLAAESTMTLGEVSAALDRVGGMPLSELIIEMRGPKV